MTTIAKIMSMSTRIGTEYLMAKELQTFWGGWIAIPDNDKQGVCFWFSPGHTRSIIMQEIPGPVTIE